MFSDDLHSVDGQAFDPALVEGKALLVVNVASKLDVNGRRRHPLSQQLTAVEDADGRAGEVDWNFEKFLISPSGEIVARFRPQVIPEDPQLTDAIERVLR